MTAPLRHPVAAVRVGPLAVLEARAWARAYLWAAGEFSLDEAVDVLQADAERDGLVGLIGQDAVQTIIAAAFREFQTHEARR
jgi:hypothetical protein